MSEVKVKRSLLAHFLNITPATTATWARFGKGIAEFNVEYNAEVTEEKWIHEDNATKEVESYAPSSDVEQVAYFGNPVYDFVNNLRRTRATGEKAMTEILNVDVYDKAEDGSYWAEKQKVSISIGSYGGSNVSVSYAINYVGDPVIGKVTIENGVPTFTANPEGE